MKSAAQAESLPTAKRPAAAGAVLFLHSAGRFRATAPDFRLQIIESNAKIKFHDR
jgi:hypothetical protein